MTDMILPLPDPAFVWRMMPMGPALECVPLARVASHLFTTRAWGLVGPVGPVGQIAQEGDLWEEVARAIGVSAGMLVRMHQVHGNRASRAVHGGELPAADILTNDDPAMAIAVQAADCVPILIADTRTGVVAAALAGWRGLAARVPALAVEALATTFGSRAGDLMAATGPSIGPCCYEVGRDVRDAFRSAGFGADCLARWFTDEPARLAGNPPFPGRSPRANAGHWFFDGWRSVREQLESAGIPPESIHVARLCTGSHPGVFCSYRRDGAGAGRLAGVIRPASRRR
jgi:YfiH family protein